MSPSKSISTGGKVDQPAFFMALVSRAFPAIISRNQGRRLWAAVGAVGTSSQVVKDGGELCLNDLAKEQSDCLSLDRAKRRRNVSARGTTALRREASSTELLLEMAKEGSECLSLERSSFALPKTALLPRT